MWLHAIQHTYKGRAYTVFPPLDAATFIAFSFAPVRRLFGVKPTISTFNYLFGLNCTGGTLIKIDKLSKTLQKSTLNGISRLGSCCAYMSDSIERVKTPEAFDRFFEVDGEISD